MKSVDFLIIGGGAAGTTAAGVIRSLAPDKSIVVISEENHEQYSRVLLPRYVQQKISKEQVFLKKPQWYQEKKIELVKGAKAVSLEPEGRKVKVSSGKEYQYEKLLIAIGGEVIKLDALGADFENILYFRTIEDVDKIVKVASQSQKGIIVGGGFVSLDFATAFRANGVEEITMLVREPYYWADKLDEESSKILQNTLQQNGIRILTKKEVSSFEPKSIERFLLKRVVGAVKTKSGDEFRCDVVGVGIGIRPNFEWLVKAGIKTNIGIVTNEFLETSLPDIYAAGDCAEFYDALFKRQHIVGNWSNATNQGSIVGRTMVGNRTKFETVSSYSDTFFDGSYSFVGVTDENFADEVISRGSAGENKMTRIFIKEIGGSMRIVGATVINAPEEILPLTTAIKNKINMVSYKEKLKDTSFNLKELVSV